MRKWFWRLVIIGLGGLLAILLLRLLRDEQEREHAVLMPARRTMPMPDMDAGAAPQAVSAPPHLVSDPVAAAALPQAAPQPDDLTRINGIGPAYARALAALGITSYAALAGQDAHILAERLRANKVRVIGDRIQSEDWLGQARQLAAEQAKT